MNKRFGFMFALISCAILYSLSFYLVIPTLMFSDSQASAETLPSGVLAANKANVNVSLANTPVYFEQNYGQFDKRVKYFARGTSGYSLFLTGTEAIYVLQESKPAETGDELENTDFRGLEKGLKAKTGERAAAVYMTLSGANQNSQSVGLEPMEHKTNYFKGRESNWRTEIPNFKQIQMNDVYEGIDAVWKGKADGVMQYDFVIEPNADPSIIEWQITGADSVSIDESGDLLINTEFGTIRQQKPFSFQEESNGFRQEIESGFTLVNQDPPKGVSNPKSFTVKFNVGTYARSKILTIDPSVSLSNLSFSTLLGGTLDEASYSIAVDRSGSVYITGSTASPGFPTTPGTFDTTLNGFQDVFVSKLNAAGTTLLYSTFIGGTAANSGYGIAVDATGNVFITGETADSSLDFPTTAGAFDTTQNGLFDAFVTKLNPAGSALLYSTFIGGDSKDSGQSVTTDASGNAYVIGTTESGSGNFPVTVGAFDTTHNGNKDVFVAKINPSGASLLYSTFLGGDDDDTGSDIAVDASGSAFVTGTTFDGVIDFPTTIGVFDPSQNGGSDVFVTKLNPSGSALDYSTFLGGSGADRGNSIAIDAYGKATVTGGTASVNYPTTPGAFQTSGSSSFDVFVTRLNSSALSLDYSAFFGGDDYDEAFGIEVDASGNAIVTGVATANFNLDYPTTAGAYQTSPGGGLSTEVIVTKLSGNGSTLAYSTFIGGGGSEEGRAIALDPAGNVFITGFTSESGQRYPTTSEVFQINNAGNSDSFVSKFGDFSISGRTTDTSGIALPNTAIALSGDGSGFMLSDSNGYFYFGDTLPSSLAGGDYLVSASHILYNFNPPNYQLNVNRNKQINFVGRPTTSGPSAAFADLGGKVASTVGNVGLADTRLTLIDTVNGNVFTSMSDANGDYRFNQVTGRFYLVVAEREGYNFSPPIQQVNHFEDNLNLDFTATPNSPRPVNDFDGDGKTDLAVFRPAEGIWYILQSQSNSVRIVRFGLNGDIPVSEDYDGDNRADIAVYRPSDGNWYHLNSSNGEFYAIRFGSSEDKPVPADFDGDGKTDIAVYRPSTGVWHRLENSSGAYKSVQFGLATDKPAPADFDRDGKADLTVFREGIWYRLRSSDGQVQIEQFGIAGDIPLPMDFSGDGTPDTAVYRPSNGIWYWLGSSNGDFQARQFGISTDIPTPADYNGDGRYEQSVFRNGIWYVLRNDGSFYSSQFGQTGDIPVN